MKSNKAIAGMGENSIGPAGRRTGAGKANAGDLRKERAPLLNVVQGKLNRLNLGNDKVKASLARAEKRDAAQFTQPAMRFNKGRTGGSGKDSVAGTRSARGSQGISSRSKGREISKGSGSPGYNRHLRDHSPPRTSDPSSANQSQYVSRLADSQRKYLLNKVRQQDGR